jgi:long-subunit fatty acid transport protein
MKNTAAYLLALSFGATSVGAAGLDRSGQSVSAIFADDGATSLSFGLVMPDVTGTDGDDPTIQYDVGENYTQTTFTYTRAINDRFNIAAIVDQPYGANVFYNGSALTGTLAGTGADLSSEALSIVGRYKVSDRFSVFGGVKVQNVRAEVDLNGTAYRDAISVAAVARGAGVDSTTLGAALLGDPTAIAALGGLGTVAALGAQVTARATAFAGTGGYQFQMDTDTQPGFLLGAAYEIPDIAFRLAFTYHFEIDHTSDTTEQIFGATVNSTVDYKTPQSLNIEFQTGIAKDTLLTASYRWTDFSAVDVIPTALGSDLVNLDDGDRYTLGIARRFNENLVGSITLSHEPEGNDLVSPLGPTNGLWGVSIGARYSKDNMNFSGGINYSVLGDADAEVAGQSEAAFRDNSSLAIGFKAEFVF